MVFQVHTIGSSHTYPCFQQAAVMQMQMNEAKLNDLYHMPENQYLGRDLINIAE